MREITGPMAEASALTAATHRWREVLTKAADDCEVPGLLVHGAAVAALTILAETAGPRACAHWLRTIADAIESDVQ